MGNILNYCKFLLISVKLKIIRVFILLAHRLIFHMGPRIKKLWRLLGSNIYI